MDKTRVEAELGEFTPIFIIRNPSLIDNDLQRLTFMKDARIRSREQGQGQTVLVPPARTSRPNSPYVSGGSNPSSGYATPREAREEQWRLESEGVTKPSKNEMREMYKELGGRKSRGKGKFGPSAGIRNKGGYGDDDDGY